MKVRRTISILIMVLLSFNILMAEEETGQSLYLEASKLIREENYADAKVLLERILKEFPADEIALKADEKLSEILDQASTQARDRMFRNGPGLYAILWNGESHPIQAYKVTQNNFGAETGEPERGIIRALSYNTKYQEFVLSDIEKLLLFTPTEDMNLFRFEMIDPTSTGIYHTLSDNGVLISTVKEPRVYEIDYNMMIESAADRAEEHKEKEGGITINLFGSKKKAAVSPSGIVGISAPPSLEPDALFLSQAVGTYGKNPGPVINVVWPFKYVKNNRIYLYSMYSNMDYGERIRIANEMMSSHSKDPSIEWYIAEQYANLGDCEKYIEWSRKQFEKAQELNSTEIMDAASRNINWGNKLQDLSELMADRDNHQFTDGEVAMLESCAKEYDDAHIAYYLLSIARHQREDYKEAEKDLKRAEKYLKDDMPFMTYCGLLGQTPLPLSDAYKSAKNLYKENRKEITKIRKGK